MEFDCFRCLTLIAVYLLRIAASDGQNAFSYDVVDGTKNFINIQHSDDVRVIIKSSSREKRDAAAEKAVLSANSPEDDLFTQVDIPEDSLVEERKKGETEVNIDEEENDPMRYYHSKMVDFSDVWVDLDTWSPDTVKEHEMLSKSYRRAATIMLNFSFPFYGHPVDNITIATGGFIYTGQYVHSWLAATQYIAPLMANFDTSQDKSAKIRYADNGTSLVVQWENVHLKNIYGSNVKRVNGTNNNNATTFEYDEEWDSAVNDANKGDPQGPFTFQAILHKNGDIAFAYKAVPLKVNAINDHEHPVKVGLSDAYIIDRTIFFVRRKTIYEYHRVHLDGTEISNQTAIRFTALDTCNRGLSCGECVAMPEKLGCMWCPKLRLCSDGMDRNRQKWLSARCGRQYAKGEKIDCDKLSLAAKEDEAADGDATFDPNYATGDHRGGGLNHGHYGPTDNDFAYHDHGHENDLLKVESTAAGQKHALHASLATVTIFTMILVACFVWCCYAYFFPHSWSGQMLIKYRPTRWQWLQSEPRYTAASIHM